MSGKAKAEMFATVMALLVVAFIVYIGFDANNVTYWREVDSVKDDNGRTIKLMVIGAIIFGGAFFASVHLDAVDNGENDDQPDED